MYLDLYFAWRRENHFRIIPADQVASPVDGAHSPSSWHVRYALTVPKD